MTVIQKAKSGFAAIKPFFVFFIILQTILRLTLVFRVHSDISGVVEFVQTMAIGLWFDVVTAAFVLLPVAFITILLPQKLWQSRATRFVLWFTFAYALLFDAVAEHLFWTEFTSRFNFIAVDYLVYTTEVIGNISESYPLWWVLPAIGLGAAIIAWIGSNYGSDGAKIGNRFVTFAAMSAIAALLYFASNAEQASFNDNIEATELASNGMYSLFHAFWNNEIDYDRFYVKQDDAKVRANLRKLLTNGKFEDDSSFIRIVKHEGKELHKNVIIVVMESMSAVYMGTFGEPHNLTPNLDRLAREGLLFANNYATGTRTVRGLEAVTLSVPPTPGESILRRPDNGNLFSLGFMFRDRGYETKFIYGGFGYFDNMNAFFAGNGFDIVDRTSMSDDEIHFANVWGVADDDLFARVLKEADKSYADGKPFMDVVMTTSNHRPYTYPDGRIDIPPSKRSRFGGVKYADYSVGKLMEWAETKPWYKDTVFIFVSDHTAGAGGKTELDDKKYHIPMIFYSPDFIKQQKYEKLSSQMDLAPTLLGLLNFSYRSKFYGNDLLHDGNEVPHAFISNYQKVALAIGDRMAVLAPKHKVEVLTWPEQEKFTGAADDIIDDTIAYYQSASWWHDDYGRIDTLLH